MIDTFVDQFSLLSFIDFPYRGSADLIRLKSFGLFDIVNVVMCVCMCRTCVWCVVVLVKEPRADCWRVLSVDSVTIRSV